MTARFLLCFALLLSVGSLIAAPAAGNEAGRVHLECAEDPQLFIDHAAAIRTPGALPARKGWSWVAETTARGVGSEALWFRFRPTIPGSVLMVSYPPLDHVDLHLPVASGKGFRVIRSGDKYPYGSSGVRHRNFVFRLPGSATGKCAYLRVQSNSSLVVPLSVMTNARFVQQTQDEQMVLGAYYGALAIMLVYNLFLAISLRNASYLLYVLYILTYGGYLFTWNGLALRFLWPNFPAINTMINPMLVGLTASMATLFTHSFFRDSPHYGRVSAAALFGVAVAGVLTALVGLFSPALSVKCSILASFVSLVTVLVIATTQAQRGYRPGIFFAAAFWVLGAGVAANILRTAGLLPANFFTLGYGLQVSSLAEMLILSFGLANRYRVTEDERQQAQADSAAKTRFIARMSHEIRTPLNAVIGAAELLEQTDLGEEQRNYVEMAAGGGRQLLGVVNDVLDIARITSGQMELEALTFDLERTLRECLRIQQPEARRKGLHTGFEKRGPLPRYVVGDELRLSRVVINLVTNALKFTREGSVILRVAALIEPGDRVNLEISVADTGIGIAEDRQEAIFGEFSQADESVTRRFGGTGLGLAICRGIVHQMNGQIAVRSTEGEGSTFTVTLSLPIGEKPVAVSESVESLGSGSAEGSGLRILLAEDNEDNRILFLAFLRGSGHSVDCTGDGAEALRAFKNNHYDVVFMDIQMPIMDGLTAVRKIRAWEGEQIRAGLRKSPCPIYALSAHAFTEEVNRSLSAGCDDHFSKPLPRENLFEILGRVSRRQAGTD